MSHTSRQRRAGANLVRIATTPASCQRQLKSFACRCSPIDRRSEVHRRLADARQSIGGRRFGKAQCGSEAADNIRFCVFIRHRPGAVFEGPHAATGLYPGTPGILWGPDYSGSVLVSGPPGYTVRASVCDRSYLGRARVLEFLLFSLVFLRVLAVLIRFVAGFRACRRGLCA